MNMRTLTSTAFALAVALAASPIVSAPAQAGFFDDISPKVLVRKAKNTVRDAGRTVDRAASGIGREVKIGSRKVRNTVRDGGRFVERTAPKVLRTGGQIVSDGYRAAGKAARFIPAVGKAGEALANDMARVAKSGLAQRCAVARAGAAILSGGLPRRQEDL
jgi:hypothetical protein